MARGGGALNIITKTPSEDAFTIGVNGQMYDKVSNCVSIPPYTSIDPRAPVSCNIQKGGELYTSITKRIDDKLAFNFGANQFNIRGYNRGIYRRGYQIQSKIFYEPSEDTKLSFGYKWYSSLNSEASYLEKRRIEEDPTQVSDTERIVKYNRPELDLKLSHYFGDNLELNALVYYHHLKQHFIKNQGYSGVKPKLVGDYKDIMFGSKVDSRYYYSTFGSYLMLGYDFESHTAKRNGIHTYERPMFADSFTHTMLDITRNSHSFYAFNSHYFMRILF